MFTEFQNMFKKKAEKIISQGSDLLETFNNNMSKNVSTSDYSREPQKFTIGDREVEEKKLLAEGAFGFIWLAEDIRTKQQFALKRVICMTEDKIKSALVQKSIMQQLPSSPHIVKYYGGKVFKNDGNTVIVTLMELCPGGNLFNMLEKRQGKGIPEQTLKAIANAILQGLIVLHRAGFTHRDIKIENILIGSDKKMKICDFGSCTKENVDFAEVPKSDYDHLKQQIFAFTTPMYRPPQIVDPYLKYKVSNKADLWMLGCTLYTMAYFVHPFVDANTVGIAGAVFRFPVYPSETKYQVSQKMKDFIRNLLTPNPQFRPSAQKMLEILNKWDDLSSIPLNQEAKKVKIQHEQKEVELKKLNQKVSKYDGDIPLDELQKLQEKLMKNNVENYQKPKFSFVAQKDSKKVNQNTQNKKKNDFDIFNNPSQKVQKQVSAPLQQNAKKNQDVWSTMFTSTNQNNKVTQSTTKKSDFNDFGDIFTNVATSKPAYSQKSSSSVNNQNFQQFFQNTSSSSSNKSIPSPTQNIPKKETNLLDL